MSAGVDGEPSGASAGMIAGASAGVPAGDEGGAPAGEANGSAGDESGTSPPPPEDCDELETCGNGHCAPYCGECERCPEDCGDPPNTEYCPDPDFNWDDCSQGAYYDSQGFPEVSATLTSGNPCES